MAYITPLSESGHETKKKDSSFDESFFLVAGEISQWLIARKSSDENLFSITQVSGPQNAATAVHINPAARSEVFRDVKNIIKMISLIKNG